ncbi:MAG: FAD-binding oxidoreductase [Candidatus Omnitrophica bacterium]|nr:FAD-binding oxidoreductase [Candidatus Omnitrophota bacterium]
MADDKLIKALQDIVGAKGVISEKDRLEDYSHDEFSLPTIKNLPQVAVRPNNADDISKILKLANKENIPVTPRGGGTGLCGGCVPAKGGILILFDNLNKVLEVDKENLMVVVEAGVILKDLYACVEKEGLFFPPHPGDDTATIGGVVATNAGGSRAVKHGTVRNFIRGLEVVLPQGDIINIGGKFIKNSTGFSLLHLLIGSEGTLGIITKATISLVAPPKETSTLVVPYNTIHDAIKTVPTIMKNNALPLAIEFIEADAIELTEKFTGKDWPVKNANPVRHYSANGSASGVSNGTKEYLLIIVDGEKDEVERISEAIADMCLKNNAKDVFVADGKTKQKEILEFRSQMYEAMKPNCIETLDIVVPISEVVNHVEVVHKIEKEHKIWLPTYGHAGDGNAHTHIMKFGFKDGRPDFSVKKDWQQVYPVVRDLIHEDAKKRGGMVSGEHGIGLVKKEYLADFLDEKQIGFMKSIKGIVDPKGILNPDKIF